MNKLDVEKLLKNIDEAAQYDLTNNKVFGSAYFVYQKNNLKFEKCYGKVGLNSEKAVDNTTLFRLASMTKPITAIATLILVERGLISLDDSIDKYLPEFKNIHITDSNCNDLGTPKTIPTIRNILSHCAGIGSNYDKLTDMTADDKKSLDSSIAYYIKKGLDFEPTSAQMYSGTGSFDVLTKIIEIVTKTDYLSFLQKEIFEPCNMVDTTFIPNDEQYGRLIEMHQKVNGESATFNMLDGCVFESFPCTHFLGGAGLISSLGDYSKFAEMLLNKGKGIITENTFNQLCTPQVPKDIMNGKERWGLGVRVITEPDYLYLPVGAFGWSGAYGNHFWIDPINQIFAVFLKNSKFDGGAANESARNFEKAVYSSFEDK